VKKDELIAAVWGRVAVSDHSVAMVISQLRRAFNDDARAPRYIETITKRGYRMIVPCAPVQEVAAPLPAPLPTRMPERAGLAAALSVIEPRGFMLLSGAIVLAAITGVSALLLT
jgi:DNA-binding winged helix-turn-helix (wHTH) protein